MRQKGFTPIFILVVGVVILAAMAGGGYYFGTLKNSSPIKTPVISQTPQPTIVSNPSSTPKNLLPVVTENNETLTPESQKQMIPLDEIATWKTYTNETYKFSFKYPETFKVQEATPVYLIIYGENIEKFQPMLIFLTKNSEGLSRREFFATKIIQSKLDDILPYINIAETSVGNMTALRIVQDGENYKNQTLPLTNYVVSSGGNIIQIVTNEYIGKNNGKSTNIVETQRNNPIYQQILSTFKFTN